MSRIAKAAEQMKMKLGVDIPLVKKASKARKIYAITRRDMIMLEEMCINRELKTPIADLMSEAIQILYKKEILKD